MAWSKLHPLTHVLLPFAYGLSGESEHKVDADVAYAGTTYRADSVTGYFCGMATAQEAQAAVVKRLDAHAYSVHPISLHLFYVFICDVVRIHLHRHLPQLTFVCFVHA